MAYMSQDRKRSMAPRIKSVLAKYGIKGTLAVDNHRTLVLNIKSGDIDLIANFNETCGKRRVGETIGFTPAKDYISVNPYWYNEHFTGRALAFMTDLMAAMNVGNHDNSDIQSDYFDVGWYVDVKIGRWSKPYIFTGKRPVGTKKVRNLMSGKIVEIAADTPHCCDPSTETYWSM